MKKSKYFVLFAAVFAFVVGITGCEVESEKHEHTFSKEWTSDKVSHWHEATCEHKNVISDKAAHTFGEWTETKKSTETQEGEMQRTCSVCKYAETETIAKLEHVHTFGDWIVTKEATETEEGERQRTCSVCKYVEKETIAKLEHVHTFSGLTVKKEATELEDGYGERTCSTCGYVEQVPIYALNHTHKFATEWTSDETDHWHIAICGHTEVSDKEEHKWNEEIIKVATCTEVGEKKLVCSVCNRTKTEVIPATGHSFAPEWVSDVTYHWHVATCEHSTEIGGKTEHTFGEWKDVQASTDSSQQERYRICDVCSYEDKRAVSNIIDNLVKVEGITINGDETWTPESQVFIKGRKLTIPSLYVSAHELTRDEYKKIMDKDSSDESRIGDKFGNYVASSANFPNAPVNNLSWFDAIVICNKLSEKENLNPCYTIKGSENPDDWGAVPTGSDSDGYDSWNSCICDFSKSGYRLPTDVEWEYLARGGQNYKYSGSDNLDDVGWYRKNSDAYLYIGDESYKCPLKREVEQKNCNGYGLYDMSGNVAELCWDWFEVLSEETPFSGPTYSVNMRIVIRGGTYSNESSSCTVAIRFAGYRTDANNGLRIVRTVTE